jgi:pimeloyl-ACP methyl ester carboxylesterase
MESGYDAWTNGFAPVIAGEAFPEFAVEFANGLRDMPPKIAIQIARFIFESDFRHILPAIDVPTVIIQPNEDPAVPIAVGEYLQNNLKNSVLHVIKARGHLPHLTAPYAVLHCLKDGQSSGSR